MNPGSGVMPLSAVDGFVAIQWCDNPNFHTIGTRIPECFVRKGVLDRLWSRLEATLGGSKETQVTDLTMVLNTDADLIVWFHVPTNATMKTVKACARSFKATLRQGGLVVNPVTCNLRKSRKLCR